MKKLQFATLEKVLEYMENEEFFSLVEVLSEESYKEGHIPSAINIPYDQFDELAPKLLKDKAQTIIVYCSDYLCSSSTKNSWKLIEMGCENVYDFKAGKKGWINAGLGLEK